MPDDATLPPPQYSIWQTVHVALRLGMRAIEEARAVKPGPQGPRGEPGPPGEMPYAGEVCGLYELGRAYRKYDLVTLNGSEWRARRDDPGALPGDGWALAGQSGSRGKPGDRGERGMAGPPGPMIASWETRDFRIVPVMSDGSIGPPLDLRELFEQYDSERR